MTQAERKVGLHQSIDLFISAEKWSDLPRFHSESGETISWSKYASDIRELAGFLLSQEIKTESKIAILGHTSYQWCVAYSAIQSARGVVVPIYPASKPDSLQYFLDHSDSEILICDSCFLPTLSTLNLEHIKAVILLDGQMIHPLSNPVFSFQEALKQGQQNQNQLSEVLETLSTDDLAAIIYTSGTTGLPKGVMLTHANVESSIKDWLELNASMIPERAVDLHWLPLSHAFGSGAIMLGNRLGWETYFANPKNVLERMPEVKPHLFLSVPAYWEKLYNQIQQLEGSVSENFAKVSGGRLCFGLSGGAGLKKEIKEGFYAQGLLLIEGYGLTECSPTLTMNRKEKFNFDSVGLPYPSVQIKLADDGEILAKGPNIFKGYFKNEKATRESFTEDAWFKTGDIGRWLEGGFLQIIDRKKEILVTSGGKNIPPQNIERRFQDNPFIQHLVVYGDGKKYLTALVTLNEEAVKQALKINRLDNPQVHDFIQVQIDEVNRELASFETIKTFWLCSSPLTVENNLLTASFKIRRKAIYEAYGEELDALY